MFMFYKECIFCFKKFPKNIKRYSEHVIPRNIYGFWQIYDICSECMEYFGDKIDQLAIRNSLIIKAMNKLNLPDSEKLYDNLPYIGLDSAVNREVQIIRKKGNYKIKTQFKGDLFLECPEENWEYIGQNWLWENVKDSISKDEFDKELKSIKEKYNKLPPGGIISSDLMDYSIKKGQFSNIEIDTHSIPSLTQLLAKIALCFMAYVDPEGTINNYDFLRNHARFNKELPEFTINWCSRKNNSEFQKYHRIVVDTNSLLLDITLFGSLNWRVVLKRGKKLELKSPDRKTIEQACIILDFYNIEKRKIYIGYKFKGDAHFTYYLLK